MVNESLINARQCEAARGWLSWTRDDLASASGVSKSTIARFETTNLMTADRTLRDLQRAFEEVGVAFIFEGAKGVGVRARTD